MNESKELNTNAQITIEFLIKMLKNYDYMNDQLHILNTLYILCEENNCIEKYMPIIELYEEK